MLKMDADAIPIVVLMAKENLKDYQIYLEQMDGASQNEPNMGSTCYLGWSSQR